MKNILLIFALSCLFLPNIVFADGAAFMPGPYEDRWDYNRESTQSAIIDYKEGTQKMLLSVGFEHANAETVWLFPVPAQPGKVVIDVVADVPQLSGEELSAGAKDNLQDARQGLLGTQLYPLLFESRRYYATSEGVGLGGGEFQFAWWRECSRCYCA